MILYYIKLLKIEKSTITAEKNYRKDKTHVHNIHRNIDCQQKNYSKKFFIMTFLEKNMRCDNTKSFFATKHKRIFKFKNFLLYLEN